MEDPMKMAAALRGEKVPPKTAPKKVMGYDTGQRGWQLAVTEAKINGEKPPTYEEWAKRGY